jgi:hypothetical protein
MQIHYQVFRGIFQVVYFYHPANLL